MVDVVAVNVLEAAELVVSNALALAPRWMARGELQGVVEARRLAQCAVVDAEVPSAVVGSSCLLVEASSPRVAELKAARKMMEE